MVTMTSASRYVTSASRYQSRSSMYIRGLIPQISMELAEAIPIGMDKHKKVWYLTSQGHNFYKLKYISLEEVKIVPCQQ